MPPRKKTPTQRSSAQRPATKTAVSRKKVEKRLSVPKSATVKSAKKKVKKKTSVRNSTNKTAPRGGSVGRFLKSIDSERREDCQELVTIMESITDAKPAMWGDSIVGFGKYHYRYESGREGDWFEAGFSPRKQSLTLYIMGGLGDHAALLKALGPHKTGKSCLYVKNLASIHLPTLKRLIRASVKKVRTQK